jgi:chromosome segregation ATPase
MPRVLSKTKNNAGKEIKCGRCGTVITPKSKYFTWSFRYGGTHVRCDKHYPRDSELTQSKMSQAYAAREELEDAQVQAGNDYDISALIEALDSARGTVEEVKDEYQASYDGMEQAFPNGSSKMEEIQEKIDALEEYETAIGDLKDELDSEWPDLEERKPEEEEGDDWDNWVAEAQELIDRVGNLELNA